MLCKLRCAIGGVSLIYCLLPAVAAAQSSILGVVADASGAVLPGVTVEAASPALIEKLRTTVTDEEGRYVLTNLRPGPYTVSFTLEGFSPFVRDGLTLPADFAATVNAVLSLGTLAETVTVTGAAPIVDVSSTQRTTVLGREYLDAIPTGRTFQALAALVPGIKVSEPNVGGARAATQQRLTAYGSLAQDTTISVDGIKSGTLAAGGDDQADFNEAMTAQVTVQSNGVSAEVARGGVHMNLIPREGGNDFHGTTYFGYTNGALQWDNLSDELVARGMRAPDATDLIYFTNLSVGGPIIRDKIWFFGGYGRNGNNNIIADSFYPDGTPGAFDLRVRNLSARTTWQVNQKNKVTWYGDFTDKWTDHNYTSGADIQTASLRQVYGGRQTDGGAVSEWRGPFGKYVTYGKWTAPLTNSVLVESGFMKSTNDQGRRYQSETYFEPFTPAWYANASRVDLVLGTTKVAAAGNANQGINHTYTSTSSLSYVSGSHSIKTGLQYLFGVSQTNVFARNGGLVQRYRSGVPDSVQVWNTPTTARSRVNYDIGVYVQDSWRVIDRLTLTLGARFEALNVKTEATCKPVGRFTPAACTPEVPNLPNWRNVAPRFGVAYDLTGDAKTVLKGTINKYMRNATVDYAERYNPLVAQSDVRNWADCDYRPGTSTCSGVAMATNGDNIAQDNEIGPSGNRLFGLAPSRRFDPDTKRPFDIEYTISVERELLPGLAIAGAYVRRESYRLEQTANELVSLSDWTPFKVTNPLEGELMTIYNLSPAKLGQVALVDTTADHDLANYQFDGMEVTLRTRLPNGGNLMGGWSAGRHTNVACANFSEPNTFSYCDQAALGMPFRHSYKFNGNYNLPLGLSFGFTVLSNAGQITANSGIAARDGSNAITWAVPANLFPGGRTQPVTVRVNPPGRDFNDRWNELDIQLKRVFRAGGMTFEPGMDLYNVFNGNAVMIQNTSFGSALGMPTRIIQGRIMRVTLQTTF